VDEGPKELQKHEKPPAEPALRKSVMDTSRNAFIDAMLRALRRLFQDIPSQILRGSTISLRLPSTLRLGNRALTDAYLA